MNEVNFLLEMASKGGPEPFEYDAVASAYSSIMIALRKGDITKDDLCSIAGELSEIWSQETIQGFVMTQPYGYAGDFEIIDRIYNRYTSPNKHLEKWDKFSHSRKSNQAVRNRKSYFIRMLNDQLMVSRKDKPFRVLNIGSGPGRDVAEFLDRYDYPNISFDCLDQEVRAIEYAKGVCINHQDKVSFIAANVFRYNAPEKYNLVWSAGLFDYLNDRVFKFLLQRMCSFTARGGELVIGNFSPLNPDQDYMEFAGWNLNHRTPEQLLKLVEDSGIISEDISIRSEEEGINLFLHIQNPYLNSKTKKEQPKEEKQTKTAQEYLEAVLADKN